MNDVFFKAFVDELEKIAQGYPPQDPQALYSQGYYPYMGPYPPQPEEKPSLLRRAALPLGLIGGGLALSGLHQFGMPALGKKLPFLQKIPLVGGSFGAGKA